MRLVGINDVVRITVEFAASVIFAVAAVVVILALGIDVVVVALGKDIVDSRLAFSGCEVVGITVVMTAKWVVFDAFDTAIVGIFEIVVRCCIVVGICMVVGRREFDSEVLCCFAEEAVDNFVVVGSELGASVVCLCAVVGTAVVLEVGVNPVVVSFVVLSRAEVVFDIVLDNTVVGTRVVVIIEVLVRMDVDNFAVDDS